MDFLRRIWIDQSQQALGRSVAMNRDATCPAVAGGGSAVELPGEERFLDIAREVEVGYESSRLPEVAEAGCGHCEGFAVAEYARFDHFGDENDGVSGVGLGLHLAGERSKAVSKRHASGFQRNH